MVHIIIQGIPMSRRSVENRYLPTTSQDTLEKRSQKGCLSWMTSSCPERVSPDRMDAYTSLILVLLLSLTGATADLTELLERLNSEVWPWFGDRYSTRCRNPNTSWPKCYNVRPTNTLSTLNRIGVHRFTPMYELDVIFSAPAEMVDVCGKSVKLPEVEPFKLNANGLAIPNLLKQGAEIYRRMPAVKWNGTLTAEHSLLFMDAGFIKARGYIGNVTTNGTHLLGEVLWPYTPPANPNPFRNPIVILLLEQPLHVAAAWQNTMLNRNCILRSLSWDKFRDCIGYYMDVIGGAEVKGVQVFYTDGSSKYEKYRSCVEGTFCDAVCIEDFKSYAESKANSIQFMTLSASDIDMYVNLDIMSERRFLYMACCKTVLVEPFIFRGVPGDNNLVDDTAKLDQPYRIEFSGSGDIALDTITYYSVLIVDPDAVLPGSDKKPYGHFWKANLRYQDHTSHGLQLIEYMMPTPPNNAEHTYYILLYSHERFLEILPNDFFQDVEGCERRCYWDFSKLPADLKLRGISWFKAKRDNYTLQRLVGTNPSCALATGGPAPEPEAPCRPSAIIYDEVPKMAIPLTFAGDLIESADPVNPDFDYDDGTHSSGYEPLGKCATLWLISFCVTVLEELPCLTDYILSHLL